MPKRTAPPSNRGSGQAIAIPVPTTPAVIAPPHDGRAWDVRGVWVEWARHAARQVPAAIVSAVFLAAAVAIAVFTPVGDTWAAVAACGGIGLLAGRRPRRAWRMRRTLRKVGWTAYQARVVRTESAAWLVLQRDRTRANAQMIGTLRVKGGRRVREEMASPAYEHVWFAGDPRRSGVVVPAGGGPLVYVSDFANSRPPGRYDRVSSSAIQVAPRRPTLVAVFLDKVLSPDTRRNMAARKADRAIRRQQAAKKRLDQMVLKQRDARRRREAKQAAWARDHPARAARAAQRAKEAERRRRARAAAGLARAKGTPPPAPAKPTVIGLLRGRAQSRAMRNIGRGD